MNGVLYCTVYDVRCTVYDVQCTMYSVRCTVYVVFKPYYTTILYRMGVQSLCNSKIGRGGGEETYYTPVNN